MTWRMGCDTSALPTYDSGSFPTKVEAEEAERLPLRRINESRLLRIHLHLDAHPHDIEQLIALLRQDHPPRRRTKGLTQGRLLALVFSAARI